MKIALLTTVLKWLPIILMVGNLVKNISIISQTLKYKKAITNSKTKSILSITDYSMYELQKTTYGHVLRTGTLALAHEDKDFSNDNEPRKLGNMLEKDKSRVLPENLIDTNRLSHQQNNTIKSKVWSNDTKYTPMEVSIRQKLEREQRTKTLEGDGKSLSEFLN